MTNTYNPLKIACVVVTFNRCAELAKTLVAISAQPFQWNDIIVVNNNSSDDTSNLLAKEFPLVKAINLDENVASAGGFARGLEYTNMNGYDWVWLFNDDSRPLPGALQSTMPYLIESTTNSIGLIKVSSIDVKGRATLLYWNGARRPVYAPISHAPVETDLITFDGCFVSSKLMNRIGYCDPKYFMGTYEFDYCLKAKDAGFKIYTLPNGLIEDGKLGSAGGTPPWRQYYNTRNHLWLALNRKSLTILSGWAIKELKNIYGIVRYGNHRWQSLLFKFRAIRDALLNRRGKRYDPVKNGNFKN